MRGGRVYIHLFIHVYIHPSIHLSVLPSIIHPSICPSFHLSSHPFVSLALSFLQPSSHPLSVCLFFYHFIMYSSIFLLIHPLSLHPSISYWPICPSPHSFLQLFLFFPSIHLFICKFVYFASTIQSSIYSSIHSSGLPFILSSLNYLFIFSFIHSSVHLAIFIIHLHICSFP